MSLNKVMLIGNVGRDPEIRYVNPDMPVAMFSVATSERGYRLPNGTEVPEQTEWHNVVLWKSLARYAEKSVHKGDKVYVEGKIKTRSYDDKNGIQRKITEIYAENLEVLNSRSVQPVAVQTEAAQQPAAQPEAQTSADDQVPF